MNRKRDVQGPSPTQKHTNPYVGGGAFDASSNPKR